MGSPIDNLKQQAMQQGKQAAQKAVKQALKSVGRAIWSAIAPFLPYILIGIVLFIVIVGCIDWDEAESDPNMQDGTILMESEEQLIKFIHLMEGGGTVYTIDGVDCYKVLSDGSAGGSAVGYGIDIGVHGETIRGMGYSTEIGKYVPVSVVDTIEKEEIEAAKNGIKNYLGEITLTDYQMCALISRSYNCGVGGCMEGYEGTPIFLEAYKQYWSQERDDKYGKTEADFTHKLYIEFMSTPVTSKGEVLPGLVERRKSEWLLFQCGYYHWYDSMNEPYKESANTTELAKLALSLIGKNHTIFTNYSGIKADWCAMFVSYCCNECGLIPNKLPCNYWGCGDGWNALDKEGRAKRSVTYIPKPGDIIFYSDDGGKTKYHTGIVVECSENGVTTVEGNNSGESGNPWWQHSSVQKVNRDLKDPKIWGYGVM